MKSTDLNLSRHPFVNARPVGRLAILLCLLGGGLLVTNFSQYWRYFSGSEERQQELRDIEEQIAQKTMENARLETSIASFELFQQNARVDFLNRKIAERTFSWSHLFDRLAEVLPADVRLNSLSPRAEGGTSDRPRRQARNETQLPGDQVLLTMVGEAKSIEAELEFVDRFFAHPSFAEPRLQNDAQTQGGLSRFNLTVEYFPHRLADDETFTVADRDPDQTLSGTGEGSENPGPERIVLSLDGTSERDTQVLFASPEDPAVEPAPQRTTRPRRRSLNPGEGDEVARAPSTRRGSRRRRSSTSRNQPSSSDSASRRGSADRGSSGRASPGLTMGVLPGGVGSRGETASTAAEGSSSRSGRTGSRRTRSTSSRRQPNRPQAPPRGSEEADVPSGSQNDDRDRPTGRRPSASAPLEIQ